MTPRLRISIFHLAKNLNLNLGPMKPVSLNSVLVYLLSGCYCTIANNNNDDNVSYVIYWALCLKTRRSPVGVTTFELATNFGNQSAVSCLAIKLKRTTTTNTVISVSRCCPLVASNRIKANHIRWTSSSSSSRRGTSLMRKSNHTNDGLDDRWNLCIFLFRFYWLAIIITTIIIIARQQLPMVSSFNQ